ncbi:sulfatase-like hydrolase/transferase [Salinibaculum marinum]
MDVHGPLEPRVVGEGGLSSDGQLSQFRSHARRVSKVYDPAAEARYDSAVQYVDQQVQRIVDWIQDEGLWEEKALIVTADHGDALSDRGIYGHPQHYMYDELLACG